jgi:hypothetical protein
LSLFGFDNLNTPNRERFGVPKFWNESILLLHPGQLC